MSITRKIWIQAPLALALTCTFPMILPAEQQEAHEVQMADQQVVMKAQKKLQKKGFYNGEIDGKEGPMTTEALKAYQTEKGIPVSGNLDARTLVELDVKMKKVRTADADDGALEKAGRATENGVRAGGEATGKGIRAAGKGTHSAGEPVDKAMDKAGEAAGKGLETGIEKTGDGLEATIEGAGTGLKKAGGAVKDAFDKDAKPDVDAQAKYDTRQTADDTREAQTKLSSMGYYNGQVDGVMGPDTEEAIRKYQAKNKLPQTGQLDAQTRDKLDID